MLKTAILGLITISAIASLSCQKYSTGLQQSVARADEAAVVAALQAVGVAQQTYSISSGGNYATLEQLRDGGYLDVRFNAPNGGIKDYALTVSTSPPGAGTPASFTCNADPTKTGPTAGRHFYIDSTSQAIHVNASQPASATDPPY